MSAVGCRIRSSTYFSIRLLFEDFNIISTGESPSDPAEFASELQFRIILKEFFLKKRLERYFNCHQSTRKGEQNPCIFCCLSALHNKAFPEQSFAELYYWWANRLKMIIDFVNAKEKATVDLSACTTVGHWPSCYVKVADIMSQCSEQLGKPLECINLVLYVFGVLWLDLSWQTSKTYRTPHRPKYYREWQDCWRSSCKDLFRDSK